MKTSRIPIYVLTGFLGSGKTSLLRTLLRHPDFGDTAVIVNEFGAVGLDHWLLESSSDDTVVLQGGCVCCTVREDLAVTIGRLIERRATGGVPAFRRIVIETTGLADPVPIIFTLKSDPRVCSACDFQATLVTVDVQNALSTLARHVEAVRQLALADRIIITKVDLDEVGVSNVRAAIAKINANASVLTSTLAGLAPDELLAGITHDPNPASLPQATRWLGAPLHHGRDTTDAPAAFSSSEIRYHTFSWTQMEALDWTAFGIWLTMLLHTHGNHILRVKGILNVAGALGPIALHGVQHVVHSPVHIAGWRDGVPQSRLVFIAEGISEPRIRASFDSFMRLARAKSLPTLRAKSVSSGTTIGGRPMRRPSAPAWLKG